MKKRILSLFLVFCISFTMLPTEISAAALNDLKDNWARQSIERLSSQGIISGWNGSYRPNDAITRAEVATIYNNLMGYRVQTGNTFSDLADSDWYTAALLKANAAGIYYGSGGKMNPKANITRQEFFVTLARVLGLCDETQETSFTDKADIAEWAAPKINALAKADLITGITNHNFTYRLEPQRGITRAEVAALLDRAFPGIYNAPGTYDKSINGNAVIKSDGIVLKDMDVSGNLVIAEGVANGEATLDNVRVLGETIVRGGGEDSVVFNGDSVLKQITVAKNVQESPISIKLNDNTKANTIAVQNGSAPTRVYLNGKSAVSTIFAHNPATVISGTGTVGLIKVTANNVSINVPNTAVEISTGVTGTGVKGKLVNGGVIVKTDKDGNVINQETPGYGTSNNRSSNNSNTNGNNETVTISFDSNGGGVFAPITVTKGSVMPALPVASKDNSAFIGWFISDTPVDEQMRVTTNITLFAKYEEVTTNALIQADTIFALPDSAPDLAFSLNASGMNADEVTAALTLEVLNNSGDIELNVSGASGSFIVTAMGGFTAGGTYRLTLNDERLSFLDKEAAVRTCDFTIVKDESFNISLNEHIIYIKADTLTDITKNGTAVSSLNVSLYELNMQGQANVANDTGTFKLTGNTILYVGQIVCVHSGKKPEGDDENFLDDNIAYIKITDYNSATGVYTYVTAEPDEVVFLPDVLPVSNTADTDGDSYDHSITIPKEIMDFSDTAIFANSGLSAETVVERGDYISFYSGDLGPYATIESYGRITSVTDSDEDFIIEYEPVSEDDIKVALDYYSKSNVDSDKLIENVDIAALEADIEAQAIESGFAASAARYLAGVATETDGFGEVIEGFDPDSLEVTLDDGSEMSLSELRAMPMAIVVPTNLQVKAKISKGAKNLGGDGLSLALDVSFSVKLLNKDNNGVTVSISATFVEELLMNTNVSGSAIWKKWWIFWYIADYQFNADLDVHNYTYIKLQAQVSTATAIVDVSAQMQNILNMTKADDIKSGVNTLFTLYTDMMKSQSDWVDILNKEMIKTNLSLLLGIIQVRITANFVVSVDVKVAIGMEFEYKTGDRYTFWLRIKEKAAGSSSVRLRNQESTFSFYVMGSLGVRSGIRVEIAVGLFSVDLAGVGLGAELGVYMRLNGYFYYKASSLNGVVTSINKAGALYLELGIYVELYFKAQALNEKFQYQPTLYDKEWPILYAGDEYNVYDFSDAGKITEIKMKDKVKNFTIPGEVFIMKYLNLAEGGYQNKAYQQPSFDITFTNQDFYLSGNQVFVKVPPGARVVEGNMIVRYKNANLAFTSLPISQTIRLRWDDTVESFSTVNFDSNGGSKVNSITVPFGTVLPRPADPIRAGYVFDAWYADATLTNRFNGRPNVANMTVYAKWWSLNNAPYKVEHYLRDIGGKTYTLTEVQNLTGMAGTKIAPPVKSYAGFIAPSTRTDYININGSSVFKYFYEREDYTLTFRPNYEGASDMVVARKFGESIIPPIMAREGYTFTGWDTTVAGTMPPANTTYTGNWVINQYNVEYWVNGVQDTANSGSKTFGTPLNFTPAVQADQAFIGWFTDSAYAQPFAGKTVPAKDLKLYGRIIKKGALDAGSFVELKAIIDAGTYENQTIRLTDNIVATSQLTLKKSCTIDGLGYTIGRSNGLTSGAVFAIDGIGKTVTFTNIIIDGNNIESGRGAIYAKAGNLVFGDNTVVRNHFSTGDGGGVYIANGTFTMNGGSIEYNTANYSGGGVYIFYNGSFIMNGGTVQYNEAKNTIPNSEGGGGVWSMNSFTMNNGSIIYNKAQRKGGGVYIYSGTLTFNDGFIDSNTAVEYPETGNIHGSEPLEHQVTREITDSVLTENSEEFTDDTETQEAPSNDDSVSDDSVSDDSVSGN